MATKSDIAKLDKKISALSNVLAKLGKGTSLKDLILIIRKPGWTTPAELAFTTAMLDAVTAQAVQLDRLSNAMVKAAKKVKAKG
jgi:hypothetical protein